MSEFLKLHQQLVRSAAPSGFEDRIAALLTELAAPYADEITTDALGNVICHKKGSGKKILLAAHMDAIGLMVTYIDKEGLLFVTPIGGLSASKGIGLRVRFLNGTEGTIRAREQDKTIYGGSASSIARTDTFVDIGATSRETAEQFVHVGDVCVYAGEPHAAAGNNVIGPYADDLMCCAVLLEVLKNVKECPNDLYIAFTSQEEIGSHGAMPLAEGLEPDIGIAVDVTSATDTPEYDKAPTDVALGKGCTVKIKDACMIGQLKLNRKLRAVAAEEGIPVQDEVLLAGGTDADVMQMSGRGVAASCVSVPCRNVHTPGEMYNIDDALNAARLLTAFVLRAQ